MLHNVERDLHVIYPRRNTCCPLLLLCCGMGGSFWLSEALSYSFWYWQWSVGCDWIYQKMLQCPETDELLPVCLSVAALNPLLIFYSSPCTHHACAQVVDRPSQAHRFLSRTYVQPQWVADSANWRVLADASLYAPGAPPPPHLSPFAARDADDEGYMPDYACALARLQAHSLQRLRRLLPNLAASIPSVLCAVVVPV